MDTDQKRSQRQEKRGADLLGGTRNSGSGNGPYRKNDVRSADLSVEYKTTKAKSYRLTNEELIKAEQYALLDGREMLFGLEIAGRHWLVISEDYFETLRST